MYVLIMKCTSVSGNNIGHVYIDGKVFVYVNPRPTKFHAGMTIGLFCGMFVIPVNLIYDGYPEKVGLNS